MIRVVIDTNVVVSAALNDDGLPAAVLSLAIDKNLLMFVSGPILAEYERVLNRSYLKLSTMRIKALLADIHRSSTLIQPTRVVSVIKEDESDNRFLECAQAGSADFLVTGNTKHFPKAFDKTAVVTPKQFIETILPLLAEIPVDKS
jgi:putative PIN family toxin of toxin-antitoxin system